MVLRKHECWTCVLFLPLSDRSPADQAPVSPCSAVSAPMIDISGNMSSWVQPPADTRQTAARKTDQIMLHISQNMNWSISMLLKIDLCSAKVQRKSHFCRTFWLQLWLDCSRLVLNSIITFLLLLQRSQLPSQDWRGGAGTLAARLWLARPGHRKSNYPSVILVSNTDIDLATASPQPHTLTIQGVHIYKHYTGCSYL